MQAFLSALGSFAIAFILSNLAAVLHASAGCGVNSTRFLKMMAWMMLVAEVLLC